MAALNVRLYNAAEPTPGPQHPPGPWTVALIWPRDRVTHLATAHWTVAPTWPLDRGPNIAHGMWPSYGPWNVARHLAAALRPPNVGPLLSS